MCGICGFVAKQNQHINSETIEKMNRSIFHRGPDEQNTFIKDNAALGFSRLSIVDIANGSQPFFNQDRSIIAMCNGEIYNYKELKASLASKGYSFRTNSDCEVLIPLYQEYGKELTNYIKGMFAFAILDFNKKELLLARDRTGIKPLVYADTSDYFLFASEAKAILSSGLISRSLNSNTVKEHFTFGYTFGDNTLFSNIKIVPPASLLCFDLNENIFTISEYWEPQFLDKAEQGSLLNSKPITKGLVEKFQHAISTHLIGDLPMSSYLSGGIDSTLVTTLLKKADVPDLISFSIKFAEKTFDESDIFIETAKQLQIQQKIVKVSDISFDEFKDTIIGIEHIQASTLDVPMMKLSKLVHDEGRKVVLVGEGSDELLGGYHTFVLGQIKRALEMPSTKSLKSKLLPKAFEFFLGKSAYSQKIINICCEDPTEVTELFGTYPVWYPNWKHSNDICKNFFANTSNNILNEFSPAVAKLAKRLKSNYKNISEFDKSILIELKTRLPNYILSRSDLNSMKNSVELRLPFLDNDVIDYVLKIPNLYKLFGIKEKHILRKAFKDFLPKHVVNRRKQGYNSPIAPIWNNPTEEMEFLLSKDYLLKSGIFNPEEIERNIQIIKKQDTDEDTRNETMFWMTKVLSTQILYNEYCN